MRMKKRKSKLPKSLLTFESKVGKRGRNSKCIILPKAIALNWNIKIGDKIPLRVLSDGNVLIDLKSFEMKKGVKRNE
jgi:antitoxin component of MazEF toxin-antitoxin module